MKNIAFVALAALSLATGAHAQTDDLQISKPDQPVALHVSPVAPIPPPSPHYIAGNWTFPTPEQTKAFYPEEARKAGVVEGTAVVDCLVKPDGWLGSCDMLGAADGNTRVFKGYEDVHGFGAATVALLKQYAHVDPTSVPGGLGGGARNKFTFLWRLS